MNREQYIAILELDKAELKKENKLLKERIDKAIEYIEKASDWEWESLAYQDLLELLKGDSK